MTRILVVDDTPIVREGIAIVLKFYLGWDVDQASSGFEALLKITNNRYSALLMDYNMPVMNGVECATKIRELEKANGSRTPIICMTANSDQKVKDACLFAGMDDYLNKECSNEELKTILMKWV